MIFVYDLPMLVIISHLPQHSDCALGPECMCLRMLYGNSNWLSISDMALRNTMHRDNPPILHEEKNLHANLHI